MTRPGQPVLRHWIHETYDAIRAQQRHADSQDAMRAFEALLTTKNMHSVMSDGDCDGK